MHPSTAYGRLFTRIREKSENLGFSCHFGLFLSYEWFLSGEIFYTIINPKARKFCINIQEATTGGIILNQNTIKVLLADDNKDFCDIIVDHLNKQEDITVVGGCYGRY